MTMSIKRKLALQKWEERMVAEMGRKRFEIMQQTTLDRGHRLHAVLEDYFLHGQIDKNIDSFTDTVSLKHIKSVSSVIESFERPALALESQVYHPNLNYIGYMDAVAFYKKKLVLIDWKTSNKDKVTFQSTTKLSSTII